MLISTAGGDVRLLLWPSLPNPHDDKSLSEVTDEADNAVAEVPHRISHDSHTHCNTDH